MTPNIQMFWGNTPVPASSFFRVSASKPWFSRSSLDSQEGNPGVDRSIRGKLWKKKRDYREEKREPFTVQLISNSFYAIITTTLPPALLFKSMAL